MAVNVVRSKQDEAAWDGVGRDVVRVPGAFAAGEFVSRSDVETLKQLRCVITAQSEIQHLSPACASAIYVKVPRGLVTTLMEYQE